MSKLHPLAVTLTLLITSARSHGCTDVEEAAHHSIAALLDEWSDERKADLYARIAEKVKANMTMIDMQAVINRCLWDNEGFYDTLRTF